MVVSPFNFGNLRNKNPVDAVGFITEWTVSGDVAARTITLPLQVSTIHNFIVHWGDGDISTVTSWNDPNRIHTYTSNGVYQVEILGRCDSWVQSTDAYKITGIINWGNSAGFNGFKNLSSTFFNCINLTSLPSGGILINLSTSAITTYRTFYGCTGLTSLPSDLFKNCINVTNAQETFYGCTGLTSLPSDLFRYHISTLSFRRTFYGCIGLTSLPEDLFRYNTLAYEFPETFAYCSGLTSLPENLFKYNIIVNWFDSTFAYCYGLTTLPSGLFKYNTQVNAYAFYKTFLYCIGLTSLPAYLFDYNINAGKYGFARTFSDCSNLVNIPEGLFRYNINVNIGGFTSTFYKCIKLKLNKWIFYAPGEEYDRFKNYSPDFLECFYRWSYSGTLGEAPELWLYTNPEDHRGCFGLNGIGVSNASSIPADWKQFPT